MNGAKQGLHKQAHCISLACWLFSPCIQALENTGAQSHWEPCEHWAVTALLLLHCGRLIPTVTSSPRALGTAPGIRYPSFAWLQLLLTWVRVYLEGLEQWHCSGLLCDESDSLLPLPAFPFTYKTSKAWTCPCSHPLILLSTQPEQADL